MSGVRVAVFPGLGLDEYRMAVVEENELADAIARWLGTRALDAELVSPVHALYRPTDPAARHPTWFVMVREDPETGRLIDLDDADARELPRMLRDRSTTAIKSTNQ